LARLRGSSGAYTFRMPGQIDTQWSAVGSYVPASPAAWFVFVGLFIALVALRYGLTRLYEERQTAKLAGLMKDSAAFADRWPRDRLRYAPYDDLTAEAGRCQRIIASMRQLRAAKKADRNYFDSQIPAVESWLATVRATIKVVGAQDDWDQAPRL
jgi:hypothetical protein